MLRMTLRRIWRLIVPALLLLFPAAVFAQEGPDPSTGAAVGLFVVGLALFVTIIAAVVGLMILGIIGFGAAGGSED